MPILPRYDFEEKSIIIPLLTFIVCYPVWYVVILLLNLVGIGTVVINMFEYITDAIYVAAFVIGITMFIALLASYSAFINNKKDEELKKKKALLAGEAYDVDQVAISSKYSWVYALFAVLGAVVCSALVLISADAYFIPHFAEDPTAVNPTTVALAGIGASVVLYAFADKFLLRNAANGLFYTSVEEPLVEKVFQTFDKSGAVGAEAKEQPAEVNADALAAAIAAALRGSGKKQ